MGLQVDFHSHPLTLSDERSAEEAFLCRICSEPICGLAYSCTECFFTLHKWCLERPSQLEVSAHPDHPLTLSFDQKNDLAIKCNICNFSIYDYPCAAYVCLHCQFYSHISCASLSRLDNSITFNGLEYSLEVDHSGTKNTCDACGIVMFRNYLRSFNFEKFLHVRCAFLARTCKHPVHRHELILIHTDQIDKSDYDEDLYCDLCETNIETGCCVYYCADCDLIGHISCANAENYVHINMLRIIPLYIDELKEYYQDSFVDDLTTKPHLKWKLANEDLGNQALKDVEMEKTREQAREKEREEKQLPLLDHFLHQEHPLVLFNELINYAVFCSACCNPIFGKTYICQECKFHLHLSCAQLPHQMLHWDHQEHPLKQKTESFHHFICKICKHHSYGLSYKCATCDFQVDFQCAFVNREFLLGIHKHPLQLRRRNRHHVENVCEYLNQNLSAEDLYNRGPFFRIPPPCIACGDPCEGARLECGKCKFYVHTSCSILQKEVYSGHHRHPLELDYNPVVNHEDSNTKYEESKKEQEGTEEDDDEDQDSSEEDCKLEKEDEEEYCDDCEEERDPRHWVYSCKECSYFVAHVTCANPMKETIPFKSNSKD